MLYLLYIYIQTYIQIVGVSILGLLAREHEGSGVEGVCGCNGIFSTWWIDVCVCSKSYSGCWVSLYWK